MNAAARPPIPQLVPETAPFTRRAARLAQRLLRRPVSLDGAASRALSPAESAALMPAPPARPATSDDGDAPWHDQTMPIAERMKLAEGRPLRRRMMAAMAQQDCGQCGYNCQDYSDAIFCKKEERLNLCVPGGKETARMLKSLYEELGSRRRARGEVADDAGCRCCGCAGAPAPAARATIPSRRRSCRARGSTSRAPRRKPGTSSSISTGMRPRLHGRRRLRPVPDQRSGAGRCGDRGARRAARTSRSAAARCARC